MFATYIIVDSCHMLYTTLWGIRCCVLAARVKPFLVHIIKMTKILNCTKLVSLVTTVNGKSSSNKYLQ